MPRITLQEHIRQSRIAAEANKVKGNRHGKILADLYADPAHFVEEIVQNTEDACSRCGKFEGEMQIALFADAIEIRHNGIPFDDSDVMAITTFGVTTKKNRPELNQIGKFGIGFRSVYGITDSPEIHSGEYNFRICDYEVPEFILPQSVNPFTTLIRLPLKPDLDKTLRENLFEKIEHLNPEILLFLNCLKSIEIRRGDKKNILSTHVEELSKDLSLVSIQRNGIVSGTFLRYKRYGGNNKEIAFALPYRTNNTFTPVKNAVLHVYFPTTVRFEHGFIVHARFTTTPNRENIPFDDHFAPENTETIKRLREAFALMLKTLKSKNRFVPSFFTLFDFKREHLSIVATALLDEMSDLLRDERILKGQTGKLFTSLMLGLPEDDLMLEIACAKYLSRHFSVFDWINEAYLRIPDFIAFLKSTRQSKWIDKETFAYTLKNHPELLEKQTPGFYQTFFLFLSAHPSLWDKQYAGRYYNIRFCPIIPVRGQRMAIPFDEKNNPLVYLRAKTRKAVTVIPELTENPDSLRFLRQLGLPELAGGEEDLRSLFAAFGKEKPEKWWKQLLEIWSDLEDKLRERLIDFIENNDSVPVELSGEILSVRKPSECCFARPALKIFLSGTPSAFVSERFLHAFSTDIERHECLYHVLIRAGVSSLPLRKPFTPEYPVEHLKKLRAENDFNPVVKQNIVDFRPDGLDNFLNNPTLKTSIAFCKLLSEAPEEYFLGIYRWESYVRTESCTFQSAFVFLIRQSAFLFNKAGVAKIPIEINRLELHDDYLQPGCDWEKLELLFEMSKPPDLKMSAEEIELIRLIRKNPTQKNEFIKKLSDSNVKDLPTGLKTIVVEKNATTLALSSECLVGARSIESTMHLPGLFSVEWDILSEFTELLIRYLMTEKIPRKSDLKVFRSESGVVKISKGNIELSTVFAACRRDARDPFVLSKKIISALADVQCNVQLFLFDFSSDPLVYEVKDPVSFVKNNFSDEPVIFLRW